MRLTKHDSKRHTKELFGCELEDMFVNRVGDIVYIAAYELFGKRRWTYKTLVDADLECHHGNREPSDSLIIRFAETSPLFVAGVPGDLNILEDGMIGIINPVDDEFTLLVDSGKHNTQALSSALFAMGCLTGRWGDALKAMLNLECDDDTNIDGAAV